MSPPSFVLVSLFFFFFFFTALRHHQARAGSSFIYAGCSPSKFELNSLYQSHLNSLLASVAFSASQTSYKDFTDSDVYGLYQCRNDLSSSDCSACVQSAVGQLSLVCAESYAASLQLDGCFVRYSNEDFLGKPDTSLSYQKCGASTASDGEFLRRRDDVLDDLQNGAGFRVSGSGAVQGNAQCLGDLSAADCAACLSRAVAELKNACGSALAADVFLAQCYARYWASGYYLHPSKDYTDDDIGKTVAIIVGILAGLAVIVVLLSFLKKAC